MKYLNRIGEKNAPFTQGRDSWKQVHSVKNETARSEMMNFVDVDTYLLTNENQTSSPS